MTKGCRENLIFIPVLLGLIIEFFLKFVFKESLSNDELLFVDIQFKVMLFVLSFFIFYAAIPKSKRLLAFMFFLFTACVISSIYTSTINQYLSHQTINLIKNLTTGYTINFNLAYRCLELFIVTYWITGVRNNVSCITNFIGRYVNSISYSSEGRIK